MLLTNEITVAAAPDAVFAFLSDLRRAAPCLPGIRIEGSNGDEYRGSMRVKVGPIVANYAGTLRFVELDPDARRAVLHARADETAGRGQAEARIETTIDEVRGASRVRIDADLQVRGRVAQFGRGAIENVARRLFAEFARNLERTMVGGEPEPPGQAAQPAEPARGQPTPSAAAEIEAFDLLAGTSAARLLRVLLPALLGLGYGYLLGRLRERKARATGR
jgi:carbon monoxide dehydrogenase subunit G